jgi:hypothetical protein
MDDRRVREDVAQEAESWDGHCVPEVVGTGTDVDHRHGQDVAPLRAPDEERAGERMDEVEVRGRDGRARRRPVERVVERIARLEDDDVAGIGDGGLRDVGMPAVVTGAERIFAARHRDAAGAPGHRDANGLRERR